MNRFFALTAVAVLSAGLSGCLRTTRIVQRTQAPGIYRSAPIEVLQKEISDRDAAIKTLNASVLITASTGGGKEGKVTEYTSLRGYIFVRQPSDLRVILQKPLIGSVALDMVSDGKTFKMLINGLTSTRAIIGSNTVTKPSKNGLENLRPAVFFDSLLVPGVAADEYVSLTESTRLLPPEVKHKPAIEEPDYDLTLARLRSTHVLQTTRVIHLSRINLLPVEQDIYDDSGHPVTIATYSKYRDFGGFQFPGLIDIRRPLDEYELKVEITKLTLNGPLEDDQFMLEIPAGVPVEKMN